MPADLERQLAAYGAWLRTTHPTGLLGSDGDGSVSRRALSAARPDRPGFVRRSVLVVAALLVVVGLAGLVVSERGADPPVAHADFSSPIDPDAHLFVLPTDVATFQVSDGDVSTARPLADDEPSSDIFGAIVASRGPDGAWSDLVGIELGTIAPGFLEFGESTSIDTPTGPATIIESRLPSRRIVQQRGDRWIVVTGTADASDLVEVLEGAGADGAGLLVVDDERRTIIERYTRRADSADFSTYHEVVDPASGVRFVVETATFSSAAQLGVFTTATLTPTTVDDTRAWLMTRTSSPETVRDVAIAWRETPNRVVVVSAASGTDPGDIRTLAEQLEQVTEDQWLATLPDASLER